MRKRSPHKISLGLALLALLYPVASQPAGAALEYSVFDLGRLLGDRNVARGLNLSGQLVGRSGSHQGAGTRAFIWTLAGGPQILSTLPGGDYSEASAVNRFGQAIGSSNTGTAIRAFLWTRQAGMEDLGTLPGDSSSKAYSINDAGQVVGYSSGSNGTRAFRWTREGGMQELGTLPGYPFSVAVDINADGDVVGYVSRADGTHRAVLWSPAIQDLGVLDAPFGRSSKAHAVNDSGHVVGESSGPGGLRAFLWTPINGMEDLGALTGGSNSRALDINQTGDVVGSADSSAGTRAFVWTRGLGMRDLNDLVAAPGLDLVEALSINERGLIGCVGASSDHEDEDHGHHDGPTNVVLLIPL